jgi:acetyl-CoA carboxylase biotin carboxyl carrier protein
VLFRSAVAAGRSPALDLRFVREVARVLEEHRLTEISLDFGDGRIRLRRGGEGGHPVVATVAAPAVAAAPAAASAGLHEIASPFVGTFYRGPSPDAPAYVEVGSRIRPGQVLCIVEAMKLMNEIESEVGGTVVEILGQNGQPVEYGQALFRVKVE